MLKYLISCSYISAAGLVRKYEELVASVHDAYVRIADHQCLVKFTSGVFIPLDAYSIKPILVQED